MQHVNNLIIEQLGPEGLEMVLPAFYYGDTGPALAYLDASADPVCARCASERLNGDEVCAEWEEEMIVDSFEVDHSEHDTCTSCMRSLDLSDQAAETLQFIIDYWCEHVRPQVPPHDTVYLRESWVNCIDHLERQGLISAHEAFDAPGLPQRFERHRYTPATA